MNFLPWIIVVCLSAFAFYEQNEAKTAATHVATAHAELAEFKEEADSVRMDLNAAKAKLEFNARKIAELEGAKAELVGLQRELKENAKQLKSAQGDIDEGKKKEAELAEAKKKAQEAEAQFEAAKGEVALAKAETSEAKNQLAVAKAEIQRLQQAPQRAPFGAAALGRR